MTDSATSDVLSTFAEVFTPEECQTLIALSESLGYRSALITEPLDGPYGFAVRGGRNNSRVAIDDTGLSIALWRRIAGLVPSNIDGRGAVGLNERLRFYRYVEGQDFGAHADGYFKRENGEQSLLTLMIYLNDDYAGGETYFYKSEKLIAPETGTILIFTHQLWHAGRVVMDGCKYILRTDIMYEPEISLLCADERIALSNRS